MYRERVRKHYDRLSRGYRRVADYIMESYYDVAFMTAAQLAAAVDVDTTTVVRFSQRLGYSGYPELLADIRDRVKSEIYASYEPQPLAPDDPAGTFQDRIEHERHNLSQLLVHSPPEHVAEIAAMIEDAECILIMGEGYAEAVAKMAAEQLRHQGVSAVAVEEDAVKRAATLMTIDEKTLAIGVSATHYGEDVARALEFARQQGATTLGVIGSLASPVNRAADRVIYAPTDASGPLPSIVALTAAMSALVRIAGRGNPDVMVQRQAEFDRIYAFLRHRPDGESA
jgi:DNA-binding MurR/RpiR family transcriptional regulator